MKFSKEELDKKVDIKKLLKVYLNITGKQIFCPFHPDKEGGHKSGLVVDNRIWCFSERKFYYVSDLIKLLRLNPISIFRNSNFKLENFDKKKKSTKEIKSYLLQFKSIEDLKNRYVKILQEIAKNE